MNQVTQRVWARSRLSRSRCPMMKCRSPVMWMILWSRRLYSIWMLSANRPFCRLKSGATVRASRPNRYRCRMCLVSNVLRVPMQNLPKLMYQPSARRCERFMTRQVKARLYCPRRRTRINIQNQTACLLRSKYRKSRPSHIKIPDQNRSCLASRRHRRMHCS